MDKLKPIEPGCLALVMYARERKDLIGAIVKVLRKAENHPFGLTDVWAIDVPPIDPAFDTVGLREKYLMRIDPDQSITEEEEQCITEKS